MSDSTHSIPDLLASAVSPGPQPPRIPGHRIERLLGRGGMGEVWLAEQSALQRPVAVKVLRGELAGDADYAERFLREARAAARISHPGVVTVFDAGQADGLLYLTMELMPGGDLRQRLAGGPLPPAEIVAIGIALAEALAAIHDAGLLHRDLKPENILLDASGRPRIADLGLARQHSGDDRLTQTGASLGTPAFMAPEQASGASDLDQRADLYALGATLFALCCGRPPHVGATPWVVMAQVINEAAPDVRSLAPTVPAPLASLINRCLAKDRRQRPADARAIAAALRAGLGTGVTHQAPRRRRAWLAAALLLGLGSAGAGIAWWRSSAAATPAAAPAQSVSPASEPRTRSSERPAQPAQTAAPAPTGQSASGNSTPSVREAWRDFRRAVTGRSELLLPLDRSAVLRHVQAELSARSLPLLRHEDRDDISIIHSRIDGSDLDIRVIPEDGRCRVSVKIGNLGDSARATEILAALRQRAGVE